MSEYELALVSFVAGLGWGLIVGAVVATLAWAWVFTNEPPRSKRSCRP